MSAEFGIRFRLFSSVCFSFASSGMVASCVSAASDRIVVRFCTLVLVVAAGLGSELRVQVRLSDGLVTEEVLEADSERDTISLEFKQGDGTLITYVVDFKQVRDHGSNLNAAASSWDVCCDSMNSNKLNHHKTIA